MQELYNANVIGKHFKSIEPLVTTKIKYKDVNRKKEVNNITFTTRKM